MSQMITVQASRKRRHGGWGAKKSTDSEKLMRGFDGFNAERHLVGDGDAVAFECDNFFRMICEHPDVPEAKIDQDLRADAAFVLHHTLTSRFPVELTARVNVNLWKLAGFFRLLNAEAAPSMMQIQKYAPLFPGDGFQR